MLVTMEKTMMRRLLGAASVLALLSACGGAAESTDTSQNALGSKDPSSNTTRGDGRQEVGDCLGAFGSCIRGGGGREECLGTLRTCAPAPPPPRHPGEEPCPDGPRPPEGDAPPPPPPPYPDPEGDRPPFPDGDYPPPPDGEHAIPPCLDLLINCARRPIPIETCVEHTLLCFAGAPAEDREPPPPPPPAYPGETR